jgi:hypothetical protein
MRPSDMMKSLWVVVSGVDGEAIKVAGAIRAVIRDSAASGRAKMREMVMDASFLGSSEQDINIRAMLAGW